MNVQSQSDFLWPAPPLVPGIWHDLAPGEVMQVMIRLCAQSSAARAICAGHRIIAARMRALASIRDGLLVEFLARPPGDQPPAVGAFLYRPGLFDLLTGASIVLHRINDEGDVLLETEEQALEFAQLFCGAMNGEDGSFFAIQPDHGVQVADDHPERELMLDRLRRPPLVLRGDGGWMIDLALAYGDQIFRSRLRVPLDGVVEMLADLHLCGLSRPVAENWVNNLRDHSRDRQQPMTAYPCPVCGRDPALEAGPFDGNDDDELPL